MNAIIYGRANLELASAGLYSEKPGKVAVAEITLHFDDKPTRKQQSLSKKEITMSSTQGHGGEAPQTPAGERSLSWMQDPNTSPESDVQAHEAASARSGQTSHGRITGPSHPQSESRPPSAAAQYQRNRPGSSRARRSFAYSETPTAVASTSPTLSAAVPAASTLSGPTLASTEADTFYTLPPGQTRTSRDGTLMYHHTLEEIREAERERDRRLAQQPSRPYPSQYRQIRDSEAEQGPVLGIEQEPMLNEDYAEALATIEGVSRRNLRPRGNAARASSSSSDYREEWGRGGRGSLVDQRWSSPPDRDRDRDRN